MSSMEDQIIEEETVLGMDTSALYEYLLADQTQENIINTETEA